MNNQVLIEEINKYIDLCRKGILLNEIKNISSTPKISVVIPVYNSEKTLTYCIRSVQNQKMADIEIILVDDFSRDNSVNLINKFQKFDSRIKLIRNNKNKGTLYSRSIGALNARGKYIMSLDNDDLFINDILSKCYNEAEFSKIEIIEFSGIVIYQNSFIDPKHIRVPLFLQKKKHGVIIRQPELSLFMYYKNNEIYSLKDAYVWGKIIKTELYKNALKIIGKDIYNHNVCWVEDQVLTFGLFRISKSFKFVNIYGIAYVKNFNSVTQTWGKIKKNRTIHDILILFLSIYKLTQNTKGVMVVVNKLKGYFNSFSERLDKEHKKLFIDLYKRMLNNNYVSEFDKKQLKILIEKNKIHLKEN